MSVSSRTVAKHKRDMAVKQREWLQSKVINSRLASENIALPNVCLSDNKCIFGSDQLNCGMLYYTAGDNVDITINPTHLSIKNQRKSLHWFITMGIKKRVTDHTLSDSVQEQITQIPYSNWLPSDDELNKYNRNLDHHIVQLLVKLPFLSSMGKLIPKYIEHPCISLTQQKSEFQVIDLIDANENASEGMIKVMRELHNTFVPRDNAVPPNIIHSVDFAGDVLTTERAFAAECALRNGLSDFDRLCGLNYRPGGLHILMNLTVVRNS